MHVMCCAECYVAYACSNEYKSILCASMMDCLSIRVCEVMFVEYEYRDKMCIWYMDKMCN